MFFAPETFDKANKQYSQHKGELSDLWALGVTIYYLLVGRYPCEDARCVITLRDYIENRPINFDLIKHPPARELLESMLEKNTEKRATLEQIVKCNWITND